MNDFDPYAALQHKADIANETHQMIHEAICLIEDDRPNAAKRLLDSILRGAADRRVRHDGRTARAVA